MSKETELVRRTAALANLDVSDEEAASLGRDFARILQAFERLEGLDVEQARALIRGGEETPRTREDVERRSLSSDDALSNAPEREGDFYGVPKTLGNNE